MQNEKLMLTTGGNFEGYIVEEYLGIVSQEIVFKNSFVSNFTANLSDFFGSFRFREHVVEGATSLIENAKQFILDSFCIKAQKMGANAVLGIDFECSFGAEIVRFSVNGTAIRVKEMKLLKERPLQKKLPVVNYTLDSNFRICNCILSFDMQEKIAEMQLQLAVFEGEVPDAIRVQINLKSIWGDYTPLEPLSFYGFKKNGALYESNWQTICLPLNQYNDTVAAKCIVSNVLCGDEMICLTSEYLDAELPVQQLEEFRRLSYEYAICDTHNDENGWKCICGNHNTLDSNICSFCKYINISLMSAEDDLIVSCEKMNTAGEIYDYAVQKLSYAGAAYERLLEKLKSAKDLERLYGNNKNSAIKIIHDRESWQ